ncbi:MAG: leucine-rich repeat protein, partial [Clostridia bacterium]|nr:leucine-rich repeat protein [Clostridia bacterium]
ALPSDLTTIESQAFADLSSVDAVRIPATVTSIADDAFSGTDIVILTPAGSYASEWAQDPNHTFTVVTE